MNNNAKNQAQQGAQQAARNVNEDKQDPRNLNDNPDAERSEDKQKSAGKPQPPKTDNEDKEETAPAKKQVEVIFTGEHCNERQFIEVLKHHMKLGMTKEQADHHKDHGIPPACFTDAVAKKA